MLDPILLALKNIDVSKLTREQWILVGMALKNEGYPCEVWDRWSKNDERYKPGECTKKWTGFKGSVNPVKGGTIIKIAKEQGFHTNDYKNQPLKWEDKISFIKHNESIKDSDSSGTFQLISYLYFLFEPDDIVGYVSNDVYRSEDGRIYPKSGIYTRTVKELISSLEKYPNDLGATIGDWDKTVGAWIRFNPLDGKGVTDKNVTKFNYALVESDTLTIDEQNKLLRKLQLPIAALVYSGCKSLHAIVHIDAKNITEYRERVQFLYNYLEEQGVEIDRQNSNPSRLSRLPGVTRNGKTQNLVALNLGKKSWTEWIEFVNGESQDNRNTSILPNIEPLSKFISNQPPLPDELIKGVLRHGHKMLIAGPSKAGKSFLLMELSAAIASGSEWLTFSCEQRKVLYVNLEIDKSSCIDRFFQIFQKLNIDIEYINNIDIWNLRGYAMPLNELVPELIERVKDKEHKAIIIDPIYKVLNGDENSATDMGQFCNEFDKLCTATGCSIIYSHHHSKGAQGYKKSQDRPSGSGVFARDPDALLNISELELSNDLKKEFGNIIVFRMESSLREFQNIQPLNLTFSYPIHTVDTSGVFNKLPTQGSFEAGTIKSQNANFQKREDANEDFRNTFYDLNINNNGVAVKDICNKLNISKQAIYSRLKILSHEFECINGIIHKK